MRWVSLFLVFLTIVSCTVAPIYDDNWNKNNCTPLPYFTPDTDFYSNCTNMISNSGKYYSCNFDSGDTYIGSLKDGNKHGNGKYIWSDDKTTFDGIWKNNNKWCGIERDPSSSIFIMIKDGQSTSDEAGVDWGTVAAVAVIAGAAYAIAESDSGGGSSNYYTYDWDGFYDAYGNWVYRCRTIETGRFAADYNCASEYKDDDRWPSIN